MSLRSAPDGWRRRLHRTSPLFRHTLTRFAIATAGGRFASQYLAACLIARLEDEDAARSALHYVAL
ncbi:hypothetical protein CFB89_32180 [Burkholderia sp. AU16741]|nr:hypothetical protein CFB89_32180 [Burkholderia sp. AU16741]